MEMTIESYLNQKPSYSSQIESLLFAFKSNPNNQQLMDYLSSANIFDALKKGRDEMTHSLILADIFAGSMFSTNNDSSICRLLDLLIEKSAQQGVTVDKELKASLLSASVHITRCADAKTEYSISEYLKAYANNTLSNSQERIDLYMRFEVAGMGMNGKKNIEIFLENKIGTSEHNHQTQSYYDLCADGRRAAQFFVYLTAEDDELSAATTRSQSPAYIHITYQDLMDRIFVPLLQKNGELSNRSAFLLKEYINCLELPLLEQDDPSYLIMAVSPMERQQIRAFCQDTQNQQLLSLVINTTLGNKLYTYHWNDLLGFDKAAEQMLRLLYDEKGAFATLKCLCGICGAQRGGSPFVIHVVKETDKVLYYLPSHLYEYHGEAFASVSDAFNKALTDYSARSGICDKDELAQQFLSLYGRQKGGRAALVTSSSNDYKNYANTYVATEFEDLYRRKEIDADKITQMNRVFGDGHCIKEITADCYNNISCLQDSTLLKEADKRLYISVQDTPLYFRRDMEDKIDLINHAVGPSYIKECELSDYDLQLIKRFCENNRRLILSIYHLLTASEPDPERRKQLKLEYNKLNKNL